MGATARITAKKGAAVAFTVTARGFALVLGNRYLRLVAALVGSYDAVPLAGAGATAGATGTASGTTGRIAPAATGGPMVTRIRSG